MSQERKAIEKQLRLEAEIARLEHDIAAEREHAAGLRRTADELRFQKDILEQSYSKQLEDVRERLAAAEADLAAERAQRAELETAREEALSALAISEDKLADARRERDQLRRQLSSRDGWQVESANAEAEDFGDEGTINALMNDASWSRRSEAARAAQADAAAAVAADAATAGDPPDEEMIPPELVLAAGRKGD